MNDRCHRAHPMPRALRVGGMLLVCTLAALATPSIASAFPRVVPSPRIVAAGDDVELTLIGFGAGVDVTITLDDQNPVVYSIPGGGPATMTYSVPETFDYGTFELGVCETCTLGFEEQSARARLTVISGELTSSAFDVQVRGIEVTQGVRQDIPTRSLRGGSFILIPETTVHVANRRTVVRVYPDFDMGPSGPSDVVLDAMLTVSDGTTVLGTLSQTRTISVRRTLTDRRSSPQHAFQFTLPREWVDLPSGTPGHVLSLDASFSSAAEAPGFDTNNGASLPGVDFAHVEGLPGGSYGSAFRVRPHFITRITDDGTYFANPFEMLPDALGNMLEHMPLAEGRQGIRLWGMRFGTFYGDTDLDGVDLFNGWAVPRYLPGGSMWGHPDNTYFGMLFTPAICAGKAWVNSAYFQAYACESPFVVVAHEITHAIGSEHAGNGHGELEGGGFDPSYPGVHGQVEADAFGYNVYRGLAYPPTTGNAPEYVRHDYMSYGPDAFISAYTWNRVAANLESGSVGVSREWASPEDRGLEDWRVFAGHLNTSTFELTIGPLYQTVPPSGFDPQDGDYVVRFYDAFDDLVGEAPVLGGEVQDDLDGGDWIFIATPIRVPAGWSTMTFGPAGEEVWEALARSNTPPTVEMLSPMNGFAWPQSGEVMVSWSGFDADGDDLFYRVLGIREDSDGIAGDPLVLASDEMGNDVMLDLDELPGGGNWTIYVEVSDGFDSGLSEPASGQAVDKPPLVVVVSPRDGSAYPSDRPLAATAAFGDLQMSDQDLEETLVEWSLDGGFVGEGDTIELDLAPGLYLLEATVTNVSGLTGSHAVTFDVIDELPIPELVSPADGATGVPTPTLLEWNEVPGGFAYRVEVASEPTFDDPLVIAGPLFDTSDAFDSEPGQTYYWRVATEGQNDASAWSDVWSFTTSEPLAANEAPGVRELGLALYPNPFNPTTRVVFSVPASAQVTVEVFDARGTRVRTLADAYLQHGAHVIPWNGLDDRGMPVATGVYHVRVRGAGFSEEARAVLLK